MSIRARRSFRQPRRLVEALLARGSDGRLVEQAMATEPKPYVELLAPPASKRRKRKVKAARKKRVAGVVGAPVNLPRRNRSDRVGS